MRKLRLLCILFAFGFLLASVAGCSFVKAQKMEDVIGTYHLTNYKITDAETDKVTDCIVEKGYEVYLVVTGTEKGFYVFKDNQTEQPWYKEVWLSYEYDTEDSSKVSQVGYGFSQYEKDEYHFGVTKNAMNFYKPPYRPQIEWLNSLDGEDWNWTKESDAIDLSYATEQLGNLVLYGTN